jgi:hypothetical protein
MSFDSALVQVSLDKEKLNSRFTGSSDLLMKLLKNTRQTIIDDLKLQAHLTSCIKTTTLELFSFGEIRNYYDDVRTELLFEVIKSLTTDHSDYVIESLMNAELYGKNNCSIDIFKEWKLCAEIRDRTIYFVLRRNRNVIHSKIFCPIVQEYLNKCVAKELECEKKEVIDKLFSYIDKNDIMQSSDGYHRLCKAISNKLIEFEDEMKNYYLGCTEKIEMYDRLKVRYSDLANQTSNV